MALRHSTNSCTAHWLDAGMCVSTRWGSVYECILNKFCMWCTPLISNFYHKISVFSQFHAAWIKTILNRLPVFISQSCLNSILRLPIKISKITFLSILKKKKQQQNQDMYILWCVVNACSRYYAESGLLLLQALKHSAIIHTHVYTPNEILYSISTHLQKQWWWSKNIWY